MRTPISTTRKLISLILLALLLWHSDAEAQWISYETRVIAQGLNVPWEIRWGFDGWIWFTERSGRFTKVNPETGEKKTLLVIPYADHTSAEKGTLGFDFHPDFPDSPFVYIAYNHTREGEEFFNVMKWRYLPDTLIDPLLILDKIPTGYIHNGSRVKVGPDRKLYISTGEVDNPALAQDTADRSGKILRLELDGSVPFNNPFGNSIWSYGHRNPQGLAFSTIGKLYSTEHGHATDDEFNLISKAGNYGWPIIEGYCDNAQETIASSSQTFVEPLSAWTPAVAVTGIEYCQQATFPEWKNSMLLATLKDASLWVLKLSDDGNKVNAKYRYPLLYSDSTPLKRLRDFCFSPDGRLFVSTSNIWSGDWNPDNIIEIKRVDVIPSMVIKELPVGGEARYPEDVELRWFAATGDARYQVQVSTVAIFDVAEIVFDLETTDTVTHVDLAPTEGLCYWRIRELTSGGGWSSIDSFQVSVSAVEISKVRRSEAIYPNPSIARQSVRFNVSEVPVDAEIRDSKGQLVRALSKEEVDAREFNTSNLQSGIYFVSIKLAKTRSRIIPFHVLN